jgi:hypothetical protein
VWHGWVAKEQKAAWLVSWVLKGRTQQCVEATVERVWSPSVVQQEAQKVYSVMQKTISLRLVPLLASQVCMNRRKKVLGDQMEFFTKQSGAARNWESDHSLGVIISMVRSHAQVHIACGRARRRMANACPSAKSLVLPMVVGKANIACGRMISAWMLVGILVLTAHASLATNAIGLARNAKWDGGCSMTTSRARTIWVTCGTVHASRIRVLPQVRIAGRPNVAALPVVGRAPLASRRIRIGPLVKRLVTIAKIGVARSLGAEQITPQDVVGQGRVAPVRNCVATEVSCVPKKMPRGRLVYRR